MCSWILTSVAPHAAVPNLRGYSETGRVPGVLSHGGRLRGEGAHGESTVDGSWWGGSQLPILTDIPANSSSLMASVCRVGHHSFFPSTLVILRWSDLIAEQHWRAL